MKFCLTGHLNCKTAIIIINSATDTSLLMCRFYYRSHIYPAFPAIIPMFPRAAEILRLWLVIGIKIVIPMLLAKNLRTL